MVILRAKPEHAKTLTEIAFAAKRHWRYPEHWIQNWKSALTLPPSFIASHETFIAVKGGQVIGFYALRETSNRMVLEHLWVLPQSMRRGAGRILFMHALARVKASGHHALEIESDPNASGFYRHMGAHLVGVTVSERHGHRRELPILVRPVQIP